MFRQIRWHARVLRLLLELFCLVSFACVLLVAIWSRWRNRTEPNKFVIQILASLALVAGTSSARLASGSLVCWHRKLARTAARSNSANSAVDFLAAHKHGARTKLAGADHHCGITSRVAKVVVVVVVAAAKQNWPPRIGRRRCPSSLTLLTLHFRPFLRSSLTLLASPLSAFASASFNGSLAGNRRPT